MYSIECVNKASLNKQTPHKISNASKVCYSITINQIYALRLNRSDRLSVGMCQRYNKDVSVLM